MRKLLTSCGKKYDSLKEIPMPSPQGGGRAYNTNRPWWEQRYARLKIVLSKSLLRHWIPAFGEREVNAELTSNRVIHCDAGKRYAFPDAHDHGR